MFVSHHILVSNVTYARAVMHLPRVSLIAYNLS